MYFEQYEGEVSLCLRKRKGVRGSRGKTPPNWKCQRPVNTNLNDAISGGYKCLISAGYLEITPFLSSDHLKELDFTLD
jgi:hypothetical protein